ncbi:MAG: hypothetical protein JXB03_11740 [Spirochaetales bacterium]|nr:hypothetical protein [Spirochaetales bacterium]
MKTKVMCAALCCFFLPLTLFPQTVTSELGFYTVETSSEGATEDEALEAAVYYGINRIFRFLRKDQLFRDMFLSSWPEAVTRDRFTVSPAENGGFRALVTVKIDGQAIILAEPNYRNTVHSRLNEAELMVVKLEGLVVHAQGAEDSFQHERAGILYSQSADTLGELKALISGIGDMSVLSTEGNSVEYFRSRIRGFNATIDSGLKRYTDKGGQDRIAQEPGEAQAPARKETELPVAGQTGMGPDDRKADSRMAATGKWLLFHPGRDRLVLRFTPNAAFSGGEWVHPGLQLDVSAEKAFDGGIWGRASFSYSSRKRWFFDTPVLFNDPTPARREVVSSQVALGFYTDFLKGLGIGWQWDNSFVSEDLWGTDHHPQEPVFYASAFWGKVDTKRRRPSMLAEYSYGIPTSFLHSEPAILLNGRLKLLVRGDDIMKAEMEIWSSPQNRIVPVLTDRNSPDGLTHLSIQQGIRLAAGIRVPGPFTWGLSYSGVREANFEDNELQEFSPLRWQWGMFFEYSL